MCFVLAFARPVASGALIFGPIRFGFLGTHFYATSVGVRPRKLRDRADSRQEPDPIPLKDEPRGNGRTDKGLSANARPAAVWRRLQFDLRPEPRGSSLQ